MTRSLLVEQFNNFILTRSFLVCQCFIQFVFQYFHRHWFVPVFQIYFNMTRKRWYQVLFPSVRSVHAQLPTVLVKVYFCTGISVHWGQEPLSVFLKHGAGRALCDTYRYLQQFFVTLSFCHTVTLVTFLLWEKKNEEREFPANSERKGERVSECFQQTLRKRTERVLSAFPANTERKGEDRCWVCSRRTLTGRVRERLSVPNKHLGGEQSVSWVFSRQTLRGRRRPLLSVFAANTERKGAGRCRVFSGQTLRVRGAECFRKHWERRVKKHSSLLTPKPPTVLVI